MTDPLPSLPDPDDHSRPWWNDEPALLTWWRALNGQDRGMETAVTKELFSKYSEAIPTREALGALCDLGPLVEIGAGAGYWARLLRDIGADIVAVDIANGWGLSRNPWTPVDNGGAETAGSFPDRALFVCWPPRPYGFMTELLDEAPQQTLALITDGPLDPSFGSDPIYSRLERDWVLTRRVSLPHWPGRFDSLMIWKRTL